MRKEKVWRMESMKLLKGRSLCDFRIKFKREMAVLSLWIEVEKKIDMMIFG